MANHTPIVAETLERAIAHRDACARRMPSSNGLSHSDDERMSRYLAMFEADAAVQRAWREQQKFCDDQFVLVERLSPTSVLA